MKILITNGHLNVGGVEKSLVNLLNGIDYSRYEVDLLLFEGTGDYFNEIPKDVNVITHDFTKTYGSFISVILNSLKEMDFKTIYFKIVLTLRNKLGINGEILLKLLNIFIKTKSKYDIAIAYRVGIPTEYVSYATKADKKFVWWHHGEFDYSDSLVKTWNRAFRNIDEMICVSEYTKEMVKPYFLNIKKNVIPNMIDPMMIINQSNSMNPYENVDLIKIVSVGRFSAEKHMIDAIYAMNELIKKGYTNLIWYLIGDGSEKNKIINKIKEFNLEEKIICVGAVANPYPYIKYADIFVHLSHVESQGITILEALALNKKSVIVGSFGAKEFIVNEKNALLAELEINDLVNKIEKLILEPNKFDFISYQNETVKRFTSENIIKVFYDVINI